MIRGTRNLITVTDRKGLLALASGFYGVPEAEYDRTIRKRSAARRLEGDPSSERTGRRQDRHLDPCRIEGVVDLAGQNLGIGTFAGRRDAVQLLDDRARQFAEGGGRQVSSARRRS